jgi:serine/threonine-protein kinase
VIYFLLTGQPPFVRDNDFLVLQAHLHEQPVRPQARENDITDDLREIVLHCLAKDPAQRFLDIKSLETALAECQSTSPWSDKQAVEWWQAFREKHRA